MEALISAEQGYVVQERDGNFAVRRSCPQYYGNKGVDPCIQANVVLSRQEFARIFGRIPPSGINMRSDVFIRFCRLAGIVLYFEGGPFPNDHKPEDRNPSVSAYDIRTPMIRTYDQDAGEFDKALGLFLNDEGNFLVTPMEHDGPVPNAWPLLVPEDDFESMFGTDTRDYFANEVIRISKLAGISLRAFKKEA
jgi:hypothetical protein